jgi:hypothetical protein
MSRVYALALGLFLATAVIHLCGGATAQSQVWQAPGNASAGNTAQLPVSLVIQNALNGQMQDVQQNIFNYQFQAAGNNTPAQAALVDSRSLQLANAASANERLISTLLTSNGSIPQGRLVAMADQMNASLTRIDNMSIGLQHRASALSGASGRNNSVSPVSSLMGQLNYTMSLDRQVSGMANLAYGFKNSSGKGPKRSGHAIFLTAYPVLRP